MSELLSGLELRSTVTAGGQLRVELVDVTINPPSVDDVIVRVEAAPINPSDLGLLLGPADLSTMLIGGTSERPVMTAEIPAQARAAMRARLDQSLPVGNEGAGTVIRAGRNVSEWLGRKVGMYGGGMYTQLRRLPARDCMPLPEGASAADGASMFVNPLTALAFTETMKVGGHTGIIHSPAASNLGQILNRVCLADGIPLVNVVRSARQASILRAIGATYIVDSNAPDFDEKLANAIAETGATIAFDAIGGGTLAARLLQAMEASASRSANTYSRYGSTTLKQVYIYGGLDTGPTILDRTFGYSWNLGGWLLMSFLEKAGPETESQLRQRIAAELLTNFVSSYTATISLADVLKPEIIAAYQRKTTGEKYLIDPTIKF